MYIIGVTGNSGTGKSEFSKILAEKLQAEVINADKIVRKCTTKGQEYYDEIIRCFGDEILFEEEIDRRKLAQIVYENDAKRDELNQLTNKYIVEEIKEEISKIGTKNIIMDVPLLFESKLNEECDVTISLLAKKEIKLERIIQRDKTEQKILEKRLKIQEKDEFYIKRSNYIIINNSANLDKEANEFIETLKDGNLFNDEVVIIKNDSTRYLQFKKLLEYKNIQHGFTLRPMDFGNNATYHEKQVEIEKYNKNICDNLGLPYENIIRPMQTHTSNVERIDDEKGIYIEKLKNVDALVTDKQERVLMLSFADCTPIYIYDKKKNVISLVHSGWVGTTKKIVKCAINKLKEEYNSNSEDLICAIGPCIKQCHFEVDKDVRDIFNNVFKYMENIDTVIKDNEATGKSYIDTTKININMMLEEGVKEENIINSNVCTMCNHKAIHSYRKDGDKSGRNVAILCLK